jgi:hypothetical protein
MPLRVISTTGLAATLSRSNDITASNEHNHPSLTIKMFYPSRFNLTITDKHLKLIDTQLIQMGSEKKE